MELIDVLGRQCGFEQRVGRVGADLWADQAKPPRDAMDVRVHRQRRPAQREQQHAGGRFRANTIQRCQPALALFQRQLFQKIQVQLAAPLQNLAQRILDARRFDPAQPSRLDRLVQLIIGCVEHFFPGWVHGAQLRVGAAAVHVAGVLRKNRADQLVERVAAGRERQPAIGLDQPLVDER